MMPVNSTVCNDRRGIGSSIAGLCLAVAGALVVSLPAPAYAQTYTMCGPEVKEAVVKSLAALEDASDDEKLAKEKELYSQYQFCAGDAQLVPATFYYAARECGAAVSNLGSLYYEEMSCAGYDPQRRQFAAPIKVKQPFGFGGAPLPGSRLHVLHCVADGGGTLLPVASDSVHLANAIGNQSPTWQFAVIANANQNLHTIYPMSGQTRRARSILSWGFPPRDCNYTPIWGNALNYRIRLDQ
jgi:hypothetical protein